ncbi:unnamed protein product [Orchesella dallaii]|uniref:Uncharacterized protein n=1 Tax=Orchesella dallaii TaxID=48710 RepID=A0ABP1S9J5_9HEXA
MATSTVSPCRNQPFKREVVDKVSGMEITNDEAKDIFRRLRHLLISQVFTIQPNNAFVATISDFGFNDTERQCLGAIHTPQPWATEFIHMCENRANTDQCLLILCNLDQYGQPDYQLKFVEILTSKIDDIEVKEIEHVYNPRSTVHNTIEARLPHSQNNVVNNNDGTFNSNNETVSFLQQGGVAPPQRHSISNRRVVILFGFAISLILLGLTAVEMSVVLKDYITTTEPDPDALLMTSSESSYAANAGKSTICDVKPYSRIEDIPVVHIRSITKPDEMKKGRNRLCELDTVTHLIIKSVEPYQWDNPFIVCGLRVQSLEIRGKLNDKNLLSIMNQTPHISELNITGNQISTASEGLLDTANVTLTHLESLVINCVTDKISSCSEVLTLFSQKINFSCKMESLVVQNIVIDSDNKKELQKIIEIVRPQLKILSLQNVYFKTSAFDNLHGLNLVSLDVFALNPSANAALQSVKNLISGKQNILKLRTNIHIPEPDLIFIIENLNRIGVSNLEMPIQSLSNNISFKFIENLQRVTDCTIHWVVDNTQATPGSKFIARDFGTSHTAAGKKETKMIESLNETTSEPGAVSLRYDVACRIPKLDPFHSSIKHLEEETTFNCEEENHPLLFKSTFISTLVPLKTLEEMGNLGVKSCCYKTIHRYEDHDGSYRLSDTCYPVSLYNTTAVPKEHNYLAISCEQSVTNSSNSTSGNETVTNIVDVHAFVHFNASIEERIKNVTERQYSKMNTTNEKSNPKIANVLIFGLDGVSHMNFIRVMPDSHSYLMNELNAVQMNGFNKIGHHTFPNLLAALTSLDNVVEREVNSSCKVNEVFDDCPLIWKKFSAQGFRTSYGEDAVGIGTFNYLQRGFNKPPTDYYFRHLGLAANEYILHSGICYGPRLSLEVLLNYIKKFAYSMGSDKNYFQFIWSTALTHDYLNRGRVGAKLMRSTLEWLHKGGYLNDTILILMSDHGARHSDIVDYPQGQIELRMPYLYFVFPQWFKENYPKAYKNLQENQDRLTTPFDLYETLVDLSNQSRLASEEIENREISLQVEMENLTLPRGISQFLPIPLSRTCKMAGIDVPFCLCRNLTSISISNLAVRQAANYAVHFINLNLSNYSQCAVLTLSNVQRAKAFKGFLEEEEYRVVFETSPGNASFEAEVLRDKNGGWKIGGSIDRINLYGNQSHCVDTREAKLFCYCIDLNVEFRLKSLHE